MKKTTALLASAVFVLSCGPKTQVFSPPLALTLAAAGSDSTSIGPVLKAFSRLAAERSQGTLSVEITFSDTALQSVLSSSASSRFDGACAAVAELGHRSERFNALSLPLIFRDESHYERIIQGEVGAALLRSLEQAKLVGLGFFKADGLRLFTAKPDHAARADFKGRRLRLPQNQALRSYFEKLGAITVPVPLSQVRSALKRGLLDGAVGTMDEYGPLALDQTVREVSLSTVAENPAVLFLNRSAAEKLPADALIILRESIRDAQPAVPASHQNEAQRMADLKNKGVALTSQGPSKAAEGAAEAVYREQSDQVKSVIEKITAAR